MTKGWKIFWIVTSAIIIPGGLWAGIGIATLQQICYSVVKYEIRRIDIAARTIEMAFTMMIKNPSKLSIGIEGYDIAVALNGVEIAKLVSEAPKTIEGEKATTLVLPVKIDLKKTFGQIKSQEIVGYFITKDFEKIVVSLKGKFNGRLLKIPIAVKVDSKYTLAEIIKQMDSPSTPC